MYDEQEPRRATGIDPRTLRDIAGLVLMVAGAVTTCVALATWWHPAAGWFLAGAYTIAAGWYIASGD